eukprot:5248432-Alexandrium_andersonii.AAC.1
MPDEPTVPGQVGANMGHMDGYLMPDMPDPDILAEWDRKLLQPDYIPRVRGQRLEDMHGQLLDTIQLHLDEFTACQQPERRFVSRKEIWVTNTGTR